jgi:hypothetical protein
MRYLRLPEGVASVTVFDQTYGKDGVIVGPDGKGVEDHVAREIMAHDPRIVEYTPDGADDPTRLPGEGDKKTAFLARVANLDRTELFALGRAMKISLPATLRTENMREIVIRHAIEADPESLPMIVGGSMGGAPAAESGVITMLNPEDAASPNQGNDGLGKKSPLPGGTGATFSQSMLVAGHPVAGPNEPSAARPAPSGLGPVQATGTQQPPFNQLATETGIPAHDDRLPAFPLSVPPIDPVTGQPFAAGDPRIPETALPIARKPMELDHGRIDAHETNAAVAVQAAADRLAEATNGQGRLFTPEQEAARQQGAAAAEATKHEGAGQATPVPTTAAPGDPNRGNDAEGKKSPDAPIKH